jgi:tRNA A37 threonylcarbamoyladenosine modification protein TsaB
MYILIDNSQDKKIVFHFYLNTIWSQREFTDTNRDLLVHLVEFLSQEKKQLSDLRGLAVVVGRGKFTATRVATTMANTLSYVFKIPVLAVNGWYEKLVDDIMAVPVGAYISARYSAPANIGQNQIKK